MRDANAHAGAENGRQRCLRRLRAIPQFRRGVANVAIAAGVYNLLDKEIDTETYSYVLDGRRYNLGLTYSF